MTTMVSVPVIPSLLLYLQNNKPDNTRYMKHDNKTKVAMRYEAPVAEVVLMVAETFTMTSTQLEDYGDNPIFGMPLNPNI